LNDLGEPHEERCRRWKHGGPCWGPLRFELPETPEERHERHVDAVEAVLIRAIRATPVSAWDVREVAEDCLAAAETGF
jgi:carboxylesterase type B